MTKLELQTEDILDVRALRARADFIASAHAENAMMQRKALLEVLKDANAKGRAQARAMFDKDGGGLVCAARISWLQDQLITILHDFAVNHVFNARSTPVQNRIAVAAVGGYGRGTLAPGSDIDLLFLMPSKKAPWCEAAIEFMLYVLWDMGFKVGQASRTIEECIKQARADMTIRTAILETRFLIGNEELARELDIRFANEVVKGTSAEFIASKLSERDERHRKSGDTRYLVEPNVKEGKGGLRDLHTLFWIAKYHYRVRDPQELVGLGVLSRAEYRRFLKAEDFLWAVRCHMHFLTKKAEERLSFDIQRDIAAALGYKARPGLSAVERFMKHYFLVAKDVGDLTRILCAALDIQQTRDQGGITSVISRFAMRPRRIAGTPDFIEERGRINVAGDDVFEKDPVNLIRLFHVADIHELEPHPDALKAVTRSLKLINEDMRQNEEANRLFLSVLTSRRNPAQILRWMNEAGVLGRFIPDFGKIVSMMQFNMYHHYTVDEHLIRSIDVLASLDKGQEADSHPLASTLMPKIEDRDALYVAVLLHDIAKGRPEDHSVAGAKVARKLGPRLGLSPKQVETVAWLIEEHLAMSMVAQTRDLNDRKTIADFAAKVQSMERLKLLLVLTVCDIRAVGPGVWNGWKGQLLRILYHETEILLTSGFSEVSRKERVQEARDRLEAALSDLPADERKSYVRMHYRPYLLSVPLEDQVRHTRFIREADLGGKALATMVRTDSFHAVTEITVLAPDHPRLLAIIAGACAAAGGNIVDAQIFTTAFGRALDTIHISRQFKDDADELRRGENIGRLIENVLSGKKRLPEVIATKASAARRKDKTFVIPPSVVISNELSNKFTVIEVECLDRPGLLSDITSMLADLSLDIASARITTFGEKVIDTFYVTDITGLKITNENRQATIAYRLKAVMAEESEEGKPKMPNGIIAPLPPKGIAVRKVRPDA